MPPNQAPQQQQPSQPQPAAPTYPQPTQAPAQPYPAANAPFNDYFIWSIITMLCLSLVFGAVAFMYSNAAKKAYQQGDMATAHSKANTAKIWCIVGTVAGVLSILAFIMLFSIGAMSGY
jgi:hypothetical protein